MNALPRFRTCAVLAAFALVAVSGRCPAHSDAHIGPKDFHQGEGYTLKAESVAAAEPSTPDKKTYTAGYAAEAVLLLDAQAHIPKQGRPKAAYHSAEATGKAIAQIGPFKASESLRGSASVGHWREFRMAEGEMVLEWIPSFWFSYACIASFENDYRVEEHDANVEFGLEMKDGGSARSKAEHSH